jgi:hypothetical protein
MSIQDQIKAQRQKAGLRLAFIVPGRPDPFVCYPATDASAAEWMAKAGEARLDSRRLKDAHRAFTLRFHRLTNMGVPPALPGRQQKFDISRSRLPRSMDGTPNSEPPSARKDSRQWVTTRS